MKRNYIGVSHVSRILAGAAMTKGTIDPDNTGRVLGFRLVHDSEIRVFRGGGWDFVASYARVAIRLSGAPALAYDGIGFRLTRDDA